MTGLKRINPRLFGHVRSASIAAIVSQRFAQQSLCLHRGNMALDVRQSIIFPLSNPTEPSEATPEELDDWSKIRELTFHVAIAVGQHRENEGLTALSDERVTAAVEAKIWEPRYPSYRRRAK